MEKQFVKPSQHHMRSARREKELDQYPLSDKKNANCVGSFKRVKIGGVQLEGK